MCLSVICLSSRKPSSPPIPLPQRWRTHRRATNLIPRYPPSQFARNRCRPRLRPHIDRKPRSPSDSGVSGGSSGFMNSIGKGCRSDRSPENSTCRGSRCVATSVASDVPTGDPVGPHGRAWTHTASGSMLASPRDGSTHPSYMVNSWRKEFDSRMPRSVAMSPSAWDGPARRVPGERGKAKARPTTLAGATFIRLDPSP